MLAEPPSGTGQPCLWPAANSMVATEAEVSRLSGRNTWAADPANSALACGVRNRLTRRLAGRPARRPNRAIRNGWSGQRTIGPSTSWARSSKPATSGANVRRQAGPSTPRPAQVSSSERTITPAEPSSRGWVRSISG